MYGVLSFIFFSFSSVVVLIFFFFFHRWRFSSKRLNLRVKILNISVRFITTDWSILISIQNKKVMSAKKKWFIICGNLWRFLWDCHSVRVESYRIFLGSSTEVFVLWNVYPLALFAHLWFVIFANREQNSKSLFNREVIFNRIYVCPIW